MKRFVLAACLLLFTGCGAEKRESNGPGSAQSGHTASQVQVADQSKASSPDNVLTRSDVIRARRQFIVEVLSFDASQAFGTTQPYADYVRLRISNNSSITLPYLTILTKRYDAEGKMVGSSRKPSIPAQDIGPGETVELDYYPVGHFEPYIAVVKNIGVEIEDVIDPDSEVFFPELSGK
jgi:hypothetical protein